MAVGGRKPKPAALRVVTGNPGRRAIPGVTPDPDNPGLPEVDPREDDLVPPKKLTIVQQRLWDRYINSAWWLTEHDVPKAFMWCALEAEFERSPGKMVSSRIGQLRALGSELGLDPSSRTRLAAYGSGAKKKKKGDPAEEFFE